MVGSFLGGIMDDKLIFLTEHLLQIIILGAGAISALILLWKKYIYKGVCRFCEKIENIYKMPSRLNKVYEEIITNGGTSIKDKVNYLAECQQQIIHNQELFATKTKIILDDHPIALIETDAEGLVTWANSTYLELVDRRLDEIIGNGWVNVLAPEYREKVYTEWHTAVEQKRPYEGEMCVLKPNGKSFNAMGYGFPIEIRDTVHGYIAKVKIIVEVSPYA